MEYNANLPHADIWRRMGAFIIDYLVAIIISLIISIPTTFFSIVGLHFRGEDTSNFIVDHYPVIIGTYVTIAVLVLYNSIMDQLRW